MTALQRDFRQAFRTWRYAPWYVATVIGVLTVGIALTTVAFAVVDGVLFKPLPFPASDELFLIHAEASSTPRPQLSAVSSRDVQAWREAVPDLRITLVSGSGNASVDERFFDVIGRRPLLGGFAPEDFEPLAATERAGQRVFPQLIAYRRWLDEYGGDPAVVGQTIVTADRPGFSAAIRIAGVLPPDFVFPLDTGAGAPDALSPMRRAAVSERSLHAIARVSAAEAQSVSERLTVAARALPEASADGHHPTERLQRVPFDRVQLVALTEHLGRHVRPAFTLVLTGAGLLLLLACVNVAGLVGARNVERQRDLAVRRALGAGSWALARGLIAEVLLLAAIATGLALLVARPLLVWTIDLLPETVTLLKEPSLDLRVFAGAALVALGCALLVAAWPVRQAMRVGVSAALGRGGAGATRRTRRAALPLVSVQVALGFVLVTAGALTVSSLTRAWRNDTGFHRDHMLLLDAFVKQASSVQEITENLVGIPALLETVNGVDAVAISAAGPVFAGRTTPWSSVAPEGWKGKVEGVNSRLVSANFFGVMGLRLLDGRWPSTSEWEDGHIAFVSERAARIFWPGQSAIGRTLVEQGRRAKNRYTVAGVVGDARFSALDESPVGDLYLPNPLTPNRYGVYLHVRTREPATAVLPRVLAALSGRGLLLERASTHEDALFASIRHRALPAWLFGSLGLGALVVLGAGVLGLLAMTAAQRTREMGIRIALGATRARVVGLLLREQLLAVVMGLGAGALISAWAVRYLESQLYAVNAYDPSIWMLTGTALVAVAALGTFVPSLRAANVDPVRALRSE